VKKIPLRLYIAGNSAASQRAQDNLHKLKASLPGSVEVAVVDVTSNPELAERAAILATPTLSYEHPQYPRRVVGDLSDAKRVFEFLGIEPGSA
jgi:circadian clock protein KaiB